MLQQSRAHKRASGACVQTSPTARHTHTTPTHGVLCKNTRRIMHTRRVCIGRMTLSQTRNENSTNDRRPTPLPAQTPCSQSSFADCGVKRRQAPVVDASHSVFGHIPGIATVGSGMIHQAVSGWEDAYIQRLKREVSAFCPCLSPWIPSPSTLSCEQAALSRRLERRGRECLSVLRKPLHEPLPYWIENSVPAHITSPVAPPHRHFGPHM